VNLPDTLRFAGGERVQPTFSCTEIDADRQRGNYYQAVQQLMKGGGTLGAEFDH